jgi:hypothetical protein
MVKGLRIFPEPIRYASGSHNALIYTVLPCAPRIPARARSALVVDDCAKRLETQRGHVHDRMAPLCSKPWSCSSASVRAPYLALQAKRRTPVAFPAEWLKNGGGRDVYLPASSHQAAKPLGRYLDPPRLRFSLLSNRYFEHTVTTLGSDAFRVNRVGKNESAVKSPVTTLSTLAH